MNDKKSILKVTPLPTISPTASKSNSWLSRLQSKIVPAYDASPAPLRRQDLKRVTFCVDHLTTEHMLDDQEPPNHVVASPATASDDFVSLLHCYERACRLREEKAWSHFMQLLQTHCRFSPLTCIDLSNHAIGRMSIFGPIADTLVLDFGLQKLSLVNCGLEDAAVRTLLNSLLMHDQVIELDISSNPIKTKGFQYIAIYIAESRKVQKLNLSKTTPDRRALQYISRALTRSTSLQHLDLNQCALKSTYLEVLGAGVCRSSSLTSLSLRYNRLSTQLHLLLQDPLPVIDDSTTPIHADNTDVPSLTDSSSLGTSITKGLQCLDLTGNPIHHQLGSFCQALYDHQPLQRLALAHCQLYPHECELLADVLYTNHWLVSLDLSENPLLQGSDQGIESLKSALLRNKSLQELKLADTGLDASAAIALAEILPMNDTLTRLDLSGNNAISLAGLLALSVSIKMNNVLTFLDITIPVNDRDMQDLQNDIVAVCTTNMIQRIEKQQQQPSSSTSSSSNIPTDDSNLPSPPAKTDDEPGRTFPMDDVSLVDDL
ncbi:RNI-like protein [Hesseltinella vesiculosa]|uniref:RNI-like protein n=1 Tax=Hesseltinella vesiculosa TaxID=101127 RepID=A0A1X2G658_9FUNG|nr:RNI-like protein [Hesseltinella vesiculosa]